MLQRLWSDDYILGVFDDWVRDRRGRLWVAVEDDRVVAVAKLTVMPSREAWLHALRVDPDHQRRGIGTALLEHRLARAKRLGARVARLDTAEDNVAVHRLMRRYGFRRIAAFTVYGGSPKRSEPPRHLRASEVDAAWRLARGNLFHEDYVTRMVARSDIGRAVRAGHVFAVGDVGRPRAVAIVERHPPDRWFGRSQLRMRVIAGTRPATGVLLVALRGEARASRAGRITFEAPVAQWTAAQAGGYRRRWNDSMHVFEKRL